jgi:hypothetical protein
MKTYQVRINYRQGGILNTDITTVKAKSLKVAKEWANNRVREYDLARLVDCFEL